MNYMKKYNERKYSKVICETTIKECYLPHACQFWSVLSRFARRQSWRPWFSMALRHRMFSSWLTLPACQTKYSSHLDAESKHAGSFLFCFFLRINSDLKDLLYFPFSAVKKHHRENQRFQCCQHNKQALSCKAADIMRWHDPSEEGVFSGLCEEIEFCGICANNCMHTHYPISNNLDASPFGARCKKRTQHIFHHFRHLREPSTISFMPYSLASFFRASVHPSSCVLVMRRRSVRCPCVTVLNSWTDLSRISDEARDPISLLTHGHTVKNTLDPVRSSRCAHKEIFINIAKNVKSLEKV